MKEKQILGIAPENLEDLWDGDDQLVHANDSKFFIDYDGKTMKHILEDRGFEDCWSFVNTDTHEVVEAPDVNWLFNIIFELDQIQHLDKKLIISLLEEYFVERKKGIINEWRQLAARYLNLYPEEYNKLRD